MCSQVHELTFNRSIHHPPETTSINLILRLLATCLLVAILEAIVSVCRRNRMMKSHRLTTCALSTPGGHHPMSHPTIVGHHHISSHHRGASPHISSHHRGASPYLIPPSHHRGSPTYVIFACPSGTFALESHSVESSEIASLTTCFSSPSSRHDPALQLTALSFSRAQACSPAHCSFLLTGTSLLSSSLLFPSHGHDPAL